MEICIRHTSIPPKFIPVLISNGIILVSHLSHFTPEKLHKRTKLSTDDCERILTAIKPKKPHPLINASELLIQPFDRINTLVEDLDPILGGGVKCGQLTEISGEAGAGKSNMCCRMGIQVMLPKKEGGQDADVLFISTEGEGKLALTIKRFKILAESVGRADLVERRLHVFNCLNDIQLGEMINNRLHQILETLPQAKLVIIDSITCAFITTEGKIDFDFYTRRSLKLTRIVKNLSKIAWERQLAVVATNHVSYHPKEGQNRPALGKTWSHMCQTKIYLERFGTTRLANVTKGALLNPTPAVYTINTGLYAPSYQ